MHAELREECIKEIGEFAFATVREHLECILQTEADSYEERCVKALGPFTAQALNPILSKLEKVYAKY